MIFRTFLDEEADHSYFSDTTFAIFLYFAIRIVSTHVEETSLITGLFGAASSSYVILYTDRSRYLDLLEGLAPLDDPHSFSRTGKDTYTPKSSHRSF